MQRRFVSVLAMFTLVVSGSAFGTSNTSEAPSGSVTVPMQVELNRPYIDVVLTGPTGRHVTAHAYVDTGGGALILTAELAQKLGLHAQGKSLHEEGQTLQSTTLPSLHLGGKPVDLIDAQALIASDEPRTLQHSDAELALPGRYLRHYIVVFDYPAHKFTLAGPQALQPDGVAVRSNIGEAGMPVVWANVTGKPYGFLMDTGGQYSMISQAELDAWSQQHPQWASVSGAYGPANMLLGKFEAKLRMLRIASLQWGPFDIKNVGAISRPAGTYEKWMSNMLGTPVIGSVAGNVLEHFKVTVDYPAGKVYLKGPATVRDAPIDMIGVMLEPAAQGGYEVAGTITGTTGIEVGDRLLKVDGHDVVLLPFSHIAKLLGGSPGTTHALTLQRGQLSLRVDATVRPIL